MSNWDDTLADLPERALEGQTASRLITAAEVTFATMVEAAQNAEAAAADERARLKSQNAKTLEALETAKDRILALSAELQSRKESKPHTRVVDDTVEYAFTPKDKDSYNAKWRLDELESALMYLRVNGAEDGTVVVSDRSGISASIIGAGFIPNTVPPETPTRGTKERPKWIVSPIVLGIAAASSVGAVVSFFVQGWLL